MVLLNKIDPQVHALTSLGGAFPLKEPTRWGQTDQVASNAIKLEDHSFL